MTADLILQFPALFSDLSWPLLVTDVPPSACSIFRNHFCWRLTSNIAACFGTFGPGACNQTTGVCGGYLDRSPLMAFSHEMNDKMLPRISQMNIDHQKLFKPITKWSTRLEADNVKRTLHKTVSIATSEVPENSLHPFLPQPPLCCSVSFFIKMLILFNKYRSSGCSVLEAVFTSLNRQYPHT